MHSNNIYIYLYGSLAFPKGVYYGVSRGQRSTDWKLRPKENVGGVSRIFFQDILSLAIVTKYVFLCSMHYSKSNNTGINKHEKATDEYCCGVSYYLH